MKIFFKQSIFLLGVSLFIASAYAMTAEEARQMPVGSWPTKGPCIRDENGKMNGYREESIGVDNNVELTRTFPDPHCRN